MRRIGMAATILAAAAFSIASAGAAEVALQTASAAHAATPPGAARPVRGPVVAPVASPGVPTAAPVPVTEPEPTTTTTVAPPPPGPTITTVAPPAAQTVRAAVPAAAVPDYGCGPALAWLSTHSAPGFSFQCPGYAQGHQAMTCMNVAGVCPGQRLIVIAVPCAAAYKNEAYNSWVVEGKAPGPIDPYGYCH